MNYNCYFDGACEPENPGGNMGMGAIIYEEGTATTHQHSNFVPADKANSNNVAEYLAFSWAVFHLLKLLKEAPAGDHKVTFFGDSKLVIMQMSGTWKIKKGLYKQHAIYANDILKALKTKCAVTLQWIPNEQNSVADHLSRKGMVQRNITFKQIKK